MDDFKYYILLFLTGFILIGTVEIVLFRSTIKQAIERRNQYFENEKRELERLFNRNFPGGKNDNPCATTH